MSIDAFPLIIDRKVKDQDRRLLITNDAHRKTHRLENLYERLYDDHFGERNQKGCPVLGFFDRREPGVMGFVSFSPDNFNMTTSINVWKTENVDPLADEPFLRVGMPSWLRGFTASACLSRPMAEESAGIVRLKRLVEERVLSSVTSAAIRMILTGRARFENDDEIVVAVDKAPVLHKRSLLMALPLPIFDIMEDNNLSRLHHLLPDACADARWSGDRLLFYTTPEELKHVGTQMVIGYLYARGINVIVIDEFWQTLLHVLENILSIDGSVILRLTRETAIVDLLKCRFREKAYIDRNEVHTPAEEREILAQELWWTTLWLYSEGHVKTEEFVETAAALLECPICKTELHPYHTTEHLMLQRKLARLLSLQLKEELAEELTIYDPMKRKLMAMSAERTSYKYAFLYESLLLSGNPPFNEFLNRIVPCDMPLNQFTIGGY